MLNPQSLQAASSNYNDAVNQAAEEGQHQWQVQRQQL